MEVDRPASVGDPVLEEHGVLYVLLGQHVVSDEPTGLPLSGQHADPVKSPVLRAVIASVLNMIPHTERDPQQFVTDRLVVREGVEHAAPFDPPVPVLELPVAPERKVVVGELPNPLRRHERHRPAHIPRGEENRAAERVRIRLLGREGFKVFAPGLAADLVLRAGLRAEPAVSGAV